MAQVTKHQTRVLVAMLALERHWDHRWWSRDAIGWIVQAGGFHQIIQESTMVRLRQAGLAMVEWESWPPDVQALVRCHCGCCNWGLTDLGRQIAAAKNFVPNAEIEERLQRCYTETIDFAERAIDRLNHPEEWSGRVRRIERDEDDDDPADFWKWTP